MMNGIRLPDPINQRLNPYKEVNPVNTVQNNNTEVKFEGLRNTSPRYTPKYDIESNPASAIRLANSVGDENVIGRNGYSMNYKPKDTKVCQKQTPNNERKIEIGSKYYKLNEVRRPLISESQRYINLNSTLGTDETELMSDSDSFEDKYYRTNDPDDIDELKLINKYKKSLLNQSQVNLNRHYKDKMSKYKQKAKEKKNKEAIYEERMLNCEEKERKCKDDTQYCKLTKEELSTGLGSLGLAFSKAFKFTGKGILYLFSSITDNAEYIFETKKPEKRNHQCKYYERHQREHPARRCYCNQSWEDNDYTHAPNLHINYEQDFREDEMQGDISIKQNGIYINGNRLELSPNIISRRYPINRRENGEGYNIQYENKNYEDRKFNNKDYFKTNDDYEYYERRAGNQEILHNRMNNNYDLRSENDRQTGVTSKQNYGIKNSFDMEYPTPNSQFLTNLKGKDRELYRNEIGLPQGNTSKAGSNYSFNQKNSVNRPGNEFKGPENGRVNPIQVTSGNTVTYSRANPNNATNVKDTRTTKPGEMRKEIAEPNSIDKYKSVTIAERIRKNQVIVESLGKPSLSPCGDAKEQESPVKHTPTQPKLETTIARRREILMPNENREMNRMIPGLTEVEKASGNNEVRENTVLMDVKSPMTRTSEEEKKEVNFYVKDLDQNKIVNTISISDNGLNKGTGRISLGEVELNKSDDAMSVGQASTGSDSSKKNKRRTFPFIKETKK